MDDRDLAEWLARNVLGLSKGRFVPGTGEYTVPDIVTVRINQNGEVVDWFPLRFLDDARLLELRLRELGMEEAYVKELTAMSDAKLDRAYHYDYIQELVELVFADARTRCLAVKATWEQKHGSGTVPSV